MTVFTDPFDADLLATRRDSRLGAVVELVTTKLGLLRERRNARQRDPVRDAIGIVLAVDAGDDDAFASLLDRYTSPTATVALIQTLAAIPSVLASDPETLREQLSELWLAAANHAGGDEAQE